MPKITVLEEVPLDCVTVAQAAEMLNKTQHCIRQLLLRGKIAKKKVGFNLFVVLKSLELYYARKKKLPAWEENLQNVKNKTFLALPMAAQALTVQEPYVVRLIQNNTLEGYVTMSGDVMVARESINDYLRAPAYESESL